MPVEKSAKAQLTFALAIVKASVVSDRVESAKIEAALQAMFPGVSVILVADDDQLANYSRAHALSEFARDSQSRVILSSKITAN